MATRNLPNFANSIQPSIIPPSAGDIEEARIRRAIDLANLARIQQESRLALEQIGIQRAQLNEQAKYHEGQLQGDAASRDVAQRGQDITQQGQQLQSQTDIRGQDLRYVEGTRGQDITAATAQAGQEATTQRQTDVTHAGLVSDFISALKDRGTPPERLDQIALALKTLAPEASKALEPAQTKNNEIAVQTQLQAYQAAPDKAGFLTNLATSDPETHKQVMDFINRQATAPTDQTTAEPGVEAGKALQTVGRVGAFPVTYPFEIGNALYQNLNIKKAKQYGKGFLSGFLQ